LSDSFRHTEDSIVRNPLPGTADGGPTSSDTTPEPAIARVVGEYRDMPGLSLTVRQAQRLFGLDADTCQRVLDSLVDVGHLSWKAGRFRMADGESSDGGRTRSRRRVLIVDDEPDIVRALKVRLEAAGLTVLTAGDAVLGTAVAIRERPDVIILDIGLPGGDGHLVFERLRGNPATTNIPVVFLTARAGKDDAKRAQDAGAAGYFTKPYRAEDLLQRLHQITGRAD